MENPAEATAPKRAKGKANASQSNAQDLGAVSFPTLDWRYREVSSSRSRKASPVRAAIHELRNATPKVTVDDSFVLPEHIYAIVQRFVKTLESGPTTWEMQVRLFSKRSNRSTSIDKCL